jgi:hypothetical protein
MIRALRQTSLPLTIVDVVHVCQWVLGVIDDQGSPQTVALFYSSVIHGICKIRNDTYILDGIVTMIPVSARLVVGRENV